MPPVLMVHGAFCGGWAFDALRRPFEAAGYGVHVPDLPGHAPGRGALDVTGRSVRDYADAVVGAAKALGAPPLIVGHSLGGLVAQMAAARTPVAGLILLAPSPAWGQALSSPLELSAGAALAAVRGPYWLQAVEPDWPVVRQFSFDRLAETEARRLYARMVPESGRALFEVLNWWLDPTAASTAPGRLDRPCLVMVGEGDRVNPPETAQATAHRLGAACRVLAGRSHWLMGDDEPEVADFALGWAAGL